MVSEPQVPSVEVTTLLWALGFLSKGFGELAAAMARLDPHAARTMVHTINADMARSLIAERQKLIDAGCSIAPLREIAGHLKDTLDGAKQAIDRAAQPH